MYISVDTFIFILLVVGTQARESLFNNFDKIAQEFVKEFTNNTIVQKGSILAGDLLVDVLSPFTTFSTTFGHITGDGQEIPAFENNKNIVDLNEVPDDFKAGFQNEDARLTLEELIRKYKYPVEKHEVTTEDEYILTMYRIPGKGSPIFLMHGLGGSPADYFVNGPDNSIGYLLANDGFDIWVGNARGNKLSRRHAYLKPSDSKFWDFSFHEIGYYDLPAMIDYALKVTGRKSLRYIGYSQGTTSFFVMVSEKPEYNEKIDLMIALSPVAFMSNLKSPLTKLMSGWTSLIYATTRSLGIYGFFSDSRLPSFVKLYFCGLGGTLNAILCLSPSLILAGISIEHTNLLSLPVFLGHNPGGISIKQIVHYGQEILSGEFRSFDYGAAKNVEIYGKEDPPNYEVENIVVPVVMFYGPDDWFAHPKDVERLASKLGNVMEKYYITGFNHGDYVLAKDLKTLIYPKILRWVTQKL